MFDNPKYIVMNYQGVEVAIIFDGQYSHADVRRGCRGEVVSAGFVSVYDNSAHAYGDSKTLQVKSRPEDSRIITKLLFPS